jgi:hypothetical protein
MVGALFSLVEVDGAADPGDGGKGEFEASVSCLQVAVAADWGGNDSLRGNK